MSTIRYFFEQEITSEEKVIYKNLTNNASTSKQIGIYFTNSTNSLKPNDIYYDEIFSNCHSVFYVCTKNITPRVRSLTQINDLSSVMGFLISLEDDESSKSEYYVFAEGAALTIAKHVYYPFKETQYVMSVSNSSSNDKSITGATKHIRSATSYFVKFDDGVVVSFDAQLKAGKSDKTDINYYYISGTNKNQLRAECSASIKDMMIFRADAKHFNLMDLFEDYLVGIDKKRISDNILNKRQVMVSIDAGHTIFINFSETDNYGDMMGWLENKFGVGKFTLNVNLKDKTEVIEYVRNAQL